MELLRRKSTLIIPDQVIFRRRRWLTPNAQKELTHIAEELLVPGVQTPACLDIGLTVSEKNGVLSIRFLTFQANFL